MTEIALTRVRTRKLPAPGDLKPVNGLVFDVEVSSDGGQTWAILPTLGGLNLKATRANQPVVECAIPFAPGHDAFPDFPEDR